MHYEFDGYSEASNSPGRAAAATRAQGGGQNRDQRQDRNNNNRSNGNDGDGNQYPDGFYRGTGRFARENFESEQRERGQQQQQQQQRTFGASPYRSAAFEYMDTGGRGRSEAEWGRVFMEAFRRRAGGGGGMGEREGYGGGGGGGHEPRGYGAEREMGYEEFLSGVFGGGRFGPEADGYGYGYGSGGGVGVSFEEMFGPPPGFGEGPSSPGAGGGYGGGGGGGGPGPRRGADDHQNERDRRGGAGMTRDEFDNMFRARFEGPSMYGYTSGPPPADLFDRWHTDW